MAMDEDIWEVLKAMAERAGEIGMTQDDLQRSNDLVQKYGAERDRLFDEMLSRLGNADTSDLRDNWQSLCEKGRGALSSLNDAVPPGGGEGLAGIGGDSFYRGELKAWEQNGKADIAFVADVIRKIHDADLELIRKCEEDLRTVREGDRVVEALIQQNLGGLKSGLKEIVKTVLTKLGGKLLTGWLKEGDAKTYAQKWYEFLVNTLEDNLKDAKQKRVLMLQVLDDIKLIQDTREQLSEAWIEEMYKKGEDMAKSLADVSRTGDYNARDWGKFGEQCVGELAERRDTAEEQSKRVFGELLPTFIEERNRAFAALTDDPSQLATWLSEMQEDFETIDDALDQEDEIIKSLAEGPYKQAARETFEQIRNMFTAGAKLLQEKTKDAEDEMKE